MAELTRKEREHRDLEGAMGLRLPPGYGDCRRHYLRVPGAQCSCGALEVQLSDCELDLLGAAVAQHLLEYARPRPMEVGMYGHRAVHLLDAVERASHGYESGKEFARALARKLAELGYRLEKMT